MCEGGVCLCVHLSSKVQLLTINLTLFSNYWGSTVKQQMHNESFGPSQFTKQGGSPYQYSPVHNFDNLFFWPDLGNFEKTKNFTFISFDVIDWRTFCSFQKL